MKGRKNGDMSLGRNGGVPKKKNGGVPEESNKEVLEGRRLPREMYNFYNMDQYETSSLEEARHKDFDIWLQDFDEQVSKFWVFFISLR